MLLRPERTEESGLEFALGNGFLDRIHHQALVPLVIEGVLGAHDGLEHELKLILARLADIAMFDVEVIPILDGSRDSAFADVADECLHDGLL
jgi:cobyrinic acid a,c-diamide synthase